MSYVRIDDVSVLSNEICDRQGDRICTCQETVNQRAVILSGTRLQTRLSVVEFFLHQVFCYDGCDQQESRHFYCDIVRTGSDFYRFNLTRHKNMNNFLAIWVWSVHFSKSEKVQNYYFSFYLKNTFLKKVVQGIQYI